MNEFQDLSKDIPNLRSYRIGNNVLNIKRNDPYGFWTCHYEKGPVPEKLNGQYTSAEEAEKDVLNYMKLLNREVSK